MSRVFIKICLFQKTAVFKTNYDRIFPVYNFCHLNAFSRCFSHFKDEGNVDSESDDFDRYKRRYSREVVRSGRSDKTVRYKRNYNRRENFETDYEVNPDDRKFKPHKVYDYNYFAKERNENTDEFDRRSNYPKSQLKFKNRRYKDEYFDENEENDSFENENFKKIGKKYASGKKQTWKTNLPQYSVKLPDVSNLQSSAEHGQKLTPNPYHITPENRFKVLNSVITPLHMYSYDHQLNDVYQKMVILFKKLSKQLRLDGADLLNDDRGLICELDFTKGSPAIDEYRNKDEFTIWPGLDGNPKTVGFLVGEPSKHTGVVCVEPDELKITKKSHRVLAKLFQTYLREFSPYGVCTDLSGGGHWRRFVVRSNTNGEHMLIAIMHPQDLNYDQIQEEKERLTNYFQPLSEDHQIKSLYFQTCNGVRCTHEMSPFQLLFGDPILKETLNGLTFQLSPESFFQVNTSGAIVLYNTVIDELNLSRDVTVIDLCCGIGAISLHIACRVQRVIGIDQSKVAINDAINNAEINSIKNCTFIAGKVEDILPELQRDLSGKRVMLVANPGRDGLPMKVIQTIRSMQFIEKVVYISCKPEGKALSNFRWLMSPEFQQNVLGKPFVASHAVPVHLFPCTIHSELIITFDRVLN